MFDDLNKKKGEIEDIFADTEQDNVLDENVEKTETAKTPTVPLAGSSDDPQEPLTDLEPSKKKKIFKIIIIAISLILLSVAIYFAYNTFFKKNTEVEIESNLIVVEDEMEEEDNWPELIDPNLIIPEEEEVELEPVIEEEELTDPLWLERINQIKLGFIDTDGDGLSDVSEEYIGTDLKNPDTDSDGYNDLEEILNGYNPLGEGILSDDFSLKVYQDQNFEIIYPQVADIISEEKPNRKTITVSWPLDNKIDIYTQENIWQTDVFSWYASQFPNMGKIDNSRIINNTNLGTGIIDENGLAVYFVSFDYSEIITISWQEKIELKDYNLISIIISNLKIIK